MVKVDIPVPTVKGDLLKKLVAVEAALNKQFGTKMSLVRLGDRVGLPIPSISTGIYTFDQNVIQTGGIPKGRIIEFFGPESSGKTTIALHVIGCAQKTVTDRLCGFVDAEHALDPTYADKLGVDVDNLIVSQPDYGEMALETTIAMVESGLFSVIVVDSVSALVPKAELEGDMGDAHMGLQARLMSQAMRKLTGIVAQSQTIVIFINQIREKIGVMFGSPETTSGGRALKFFASVRVDIRRRAPIKDGDAIIGHIIELKAVKNKVGAPLRSTSIDLIYELGIDKTKDLVDYAESIGVLEKSGAWYAFKGGNVGQGKQNTVDYFNTNPKEFVDLEKEVTKAIAIIKEA